MADSDWVSLIPTEQSMRDFMRPRNENDDASKELDIGDLADSSKDSPEVIAKAEALNAKSSGWIPVANKTDQTDDGWRKVSDGGWYDLKTAQHLQAASQMAQSGFNQAIGITEAAVQPADSPRVEDQQSTLESIKKYMEQAGAGTAIDVADMLSGLVNMPESWGAGLASMLQGKSPEEAQQLMQSIKEKHSASGLYKAYTGKEAPHNPAIQSIFNTLGEAAKGAIENTTTTPSYLTGSGEPEQFGNPVSTEIGADALMLGLGLKGARRGAAEGRLPERDITSEGSHTFDPFAEQAAYTKKANEEALAKYNEDPTQYGVDESGVRNPYLFENREAGEQAYQETPKTEKSFTERHKEMVERGEAVLADAKEQGLTPKDIANEFWNKIYPKLPEEVQDRFDTLAKQNSVKLTGEIDTLEKMSRWYVALMHEANNHPWNERAKTYLENKIDGEQLDNLPDSYSNRSFIVDTPMASGAGGITHSFGDKTTDYVRFIKQFADETKPLDGGDFNKVLEYIEKNSSDPFERMLARLVKTDHPTTFKVTENPNMSQYGIMRGRYFVGEKANQIEVWIDSNNFSYEGITPATILHEGIHNALVHIVELGRDSRTRAKYPEYARFFDELANLAIEIRKGMTDAERSRFNHIYGTGKERFGGIGQEFIAYGLTDPDFIAYLDSIRLGTDSKVPIAQRTTAWQRFKELLTTIFDSNLGKKDGFNRDLTDFVETQAAMHDTAFRELVELTLPIIKFSKEIKHDLVDTKLVLDARNGGWMDMEDLNPWDKTPIDIPAEMAKPKNPLKPKIPVKTQQKLLQLVSQYKNYKELHEIETFVDKGGKRYEDLNPVTSNAFPVVMVKNIVNNPIATFGITQMRRILGDTHALEKVLVSSAKEFLEQPADVKARIFDMLTQVNRPEWQAQLQIKKQQQFGTDWRMKPEALRIDQSDVPTTVTLKNNDFLIYKKTLEPFFEVLYKIDQTVLNRAFKRDFKSDVIGYFPRYYGFGRFSVTGFGKDGEMAFYKRAKTFKEIRQWEEFARSKGLVTVREVGKDYGEFKGHLQAIVNIDPHSPMSRMAEASQAAAEEHRRTQEFERKAFNVAGFIGQNIKDPKEVKTLESTIVHRLRQTTELYKSGRIVTEIVRPMQNDPWAVHNYPNTVKFVLDFSRREMGGDLNELGAIDRTLQFMFNKAHIGFLKTTAPSVVKDLKPNELTISPTSVKELARYVTAFSSGYLLIGNVRNLAVNTATIPLVSLLGGFPDSVLLGKNPGTAVYHALKAHAASVMDWARLMATIPDPRVKDLLDKARDRGLLDPGMFADLPELRDEIELTPTEKVGRAVLTTPRRIFNDPIEKATNYMSLLYYNRLIESIIPGLSKQRHFELVEDLTKRYTGDYRKFNKQMMFDKAGAIGQTQSNFAIWGGHRIAQAYELGKGAVTKAAILPLVTLMAASILVAGIEGAPLSQDYENLRQFGIKHELFDLPPQDLVLRKLNIPQWMRKGEVLDNLTPWNLDLSTSGKWSGFSDIGGVTFMTVGKIADIIEYIGKEHANFHNPMSRIPPPEGTTLEQQGDMVSAMPPAVQGLGRQALMSRNLYDGRTTILSRKGEAVYTQKPEEKTANLLNFRTTRQTNELQEKYNYLYEKKTFEKDTKALKQTALDQMVHAINERKMGNPGRAAELEKQARTNLLNLKKASPTGFETFSHDILHTIEKESDTTQEKMLKEMIRSKDAGRIIMLLNTLRTMDQNPTSPSTSKEK